MSGIHTRVPFWTMRTLFTIGVAYFLNTVSNTDERLSQDFAASTTGCSCTRAERAFGKFSLLSCRTTPCDIARSFAHDAGRPNLFFQTHAYTLPCSPTCTTAYACCDSSHTPACMLCFSSGCRRALTTNSDHTRHDAWRSENGRRTCSASTRWVAPTCPAHPGTGG